jgi:hypothetical protein
MGFAGPLLGLAGALSGSEGDPANKEGFAAMSNRLAVALYVLAMVALIVGVDVLFLRDRFWERLFANIAIVLVFGAVYLLFLRRG